MKPYRWIIGGGLLLLALFLWAILFPRGESSAPSPRVGEFQVENPEAPGYIPLNSVRLSPAQIELDVNQGGSELPAIQLTNTSNKTLPVSMGFYPYSETSPEGTPLFSTDRESFEAGKRIVRLSRYKFSLDPLESRNILGRVVSRGKYSEVFGVVSAAVFLPREERSVGEDKRQKVLSVAPSLRLSSRTWIRFAPRDKAPFRMAKPSVAQTSDGLWPAAELRATGRISAEVFGEISLLQDGLLLQRIPFVSNAPARPGVLTRVPAQALVANLPPGEYTLVARGQNYQGQKDVSRSSFRVARDGLLAGADPWRPPYAAEISAALALGQSPRAGRPIPLEIKVRNTGSEKLPVSLEISIRDAATSRLVERSRARLPGIPSDGETKFVFSQDALLAGEYIVATRALDPSGQVLSEKDFLMDVETLTERPSERVFSIILAFSLGLLLPLLILGAIIYAYRKKDPGDPSSNDKADDLGSVSGSLSRKPGSPHYIKRRGRPRRKGRPGRRGGPGRRRAGIHKKASNRRSSRLRYRGRDYE